MNHLPPMQVKKLIHCRRWKELKLKGIKSDFERKEVWYYAKKEGDFIEGAQAIAKGPIAIKDK